MYKSPRKQILQADLLLENVKDSAILETLEEYKQDLNYKNFRYFVRDAWEQFEPHPFDHSWHIDCIAEHLQAQAEGNKDLQKLIISVPPRHCVYENERVYLKDGTFKFIKDLQVGDKILGVRNTSYQGKTMHLDTAKVLDKVYTGQQMTYKIYLTNGKTIRLTANHRLLTMYKGEKIYAEVRNLTKEHEIVCVHNYSRVFKNFQFKAPCKFKLDDQTKKELDFLATYLMYGSKTATSIVFPKDIQHLVKDRLNGVYMYSWSKYKEIFERWKVGKNKFPMALFETTKEIIGHFIGRVITKYKLEGKKLQAMYILTTEELTPIYLQLFDYIGINATEYFGNRVAVLGFKDLQRYMRDTLSPRIKARMRYTTKKTPTTKDIIYTEKIKSIEEWKIVSTYDIETSLKNFVCNGIINHNSKSTICSVMYPAWLWLRNPSEEIMTISSTNSLSLELNTKCKDLITSEWYMNYAYRFIGEDFALREDVNAKAQFRNVYGGNKFSISILSKLLGKGADTIIIDDPNDYGSGNSKDTTSFEQVIDTYKGKLISRQNRIADTKWLLIQQRVGRKDLTGYLKENEEGWFQLVLPMEFTSSRTFISPIGFNDRRKKEGQLLCPQRFPTNYVKALKADPIKWSTMYQQDPIVESGTEFKRDWLVVDKNIHNYPTDYYERLIFSVDTAYTETTSSDYTVVVKLGIKNNKIFVLDLIRERIDFPKVLELLQDLYQKYNSYSTKIILEKGSAGTPVLQMLQKSIPILEGIPIKNADKVSRFKYTFPNFMQHQIIIPDHSLPGNAWVADMVQELVEFPFSEHDDIVDALSQGIYYAKENQGQILVLDMNDYELYKPKEQIFTHEKNPFQIHKEEVRNIFK